MSLLVATCGSFLLSQSLVLSHTCIYGYIYIYSGGGGGGATILEKCRWQADVDSLSAAIVVRLLANSKMALSRAIAR